MNMRSKTFWYALLVSAVVTIVGKKIQRLENKWKHKPIVFSKGKYNITEKGKYKYTKSNNKPISDLDWVCLLMDSLSLVRRSLRVRRSCCKRKWNKTSIMELKYAYLDFGSLRFLALNECIEFASLLFQLFEALKEMT